MRVKDSPSETNTAFMQNTQSFLDTYLFMQLYTAADFTNGYNILSKLTNWSR